MTTLIAAAVLAGSAGAAPSGPGHVLVQLKGAAACTASPALLAAGASRVDGPLRLWRIRADAAARVVPALRRTDAIALTAEERTYEVAAGADSADPLVAQQWWGAAIGITDLAPPGPGVPVTIVDSGVFLGHEEFASRPSPVETLNEQQPPGIGGEHGTAVASVIGAPVNGLGLVGIYPEATLRSFDAAIGDGRRLETSEIVAGILAAARAGRGVINLSLGGQGRDVAIELAVSEAVRRGSLVVAAAGNSGDNGNPLEYPAAVPHVLTVGATGRDDRAAGFSSRSGYLDIAAPGVDIPVASALRGPYTVYSGTSFAAPLVSGAAAWVWTLRPELDAGQVTEILKRSARDVPPAGRDDSTGYGILNVPAALAAPAPVPDLHEPNDDIEYVDPSSDYFTGSPALTAKSRLTASREGRITRLDDPRDVFRIWLPKGRPITVTATGNGPMTLDLYRPGSPTVVGRFSRSDRLASAEKPGTTVSLSYTAEKAGQAGYVSIGHPRRGVRQVEYTITVS
jgi:subtilisin family serine protease